MGKMKRVELNKLNRHIYALTFGPQTIPPMNQKTSRKRMHLNYKQYKHSLCENGNMSLHIMIVESIAQQLLRLWIFHWLSTLILPPTDVDTVVRRRS